MGSHAIVAHLVKQSKPWIRLHQPSCLFAYLVKKRQALLPLLSLLSRAQIAALAHCLPCSHPEMAAYLIISAVMLVTSIV